MASSTETGASGLPQFKGQFDTEYFDSAAANYRLGCLSVPGLQAAHLLVRAYFDTKLADEARVLICGCGAGPEIEALAPSEHRYRFTGYDISEGMLEQAKRTAEKAGATDRSVFLLGPLDVVPDRPLFDAVTLMLILHFFPDDGTKLVYLRSIRRRLRPGALLALVDGSATEEEIKFIAPVWLRHAELAGGAELASMCTKMLPALTATNKARMTPERTREVLAEAGFTNITPFWRGLWYVGWLAEADASEPANQ